MKGIHKYLYKGIVYCLVVIGFFGAGNCVYSEALDGVSSENEDLLLNHSIDKVEIEYANSLKEDTYYETEISNENDIDTSTRLARASIRDIVKIDARITFEKIYITIGNAGNTNLNSYTGSLAISSTSKYKANGVNPVTSNKSLKVSNLKPGEKKQFVFSYRMKYTQNKFVLKSNSKHSSGRIYSKTDNFYKNLNEGNFPEWNRGTFLNKAASIDYHHHKHGGEVNSRNIAEYYSKAVVERTLTKIQKNYRFNKTKSGAFKYTRITSPRRYIIVKNKLKSGPNIFSFGGR